MFPEATSGPGSSLPRLLLIADGFSLPGLDQRIVQAVRYGIRWVQLRDRGARPDVQAVSAAVLVRRMRKVDPRVVISMNGQQALADELRIGLHLPAHAPIPGAPDRADGRSLLVPRGRSTHSPAEVAAAAREGMDYVLFGHVHETASHRGEEPRGLAGLRDAVEAAETMPVIAIGGITPERVGACLDAGAHGVAVLSGLMQAPNLFHAVDAFTRAIADHVRPREGSDPLE